MHVKTIIKIQTLRESELFCEEIGALFHSRLQICPRYLQQDNRISGHAKQPPIAVPNVLWCAEEMILPSSYKNSVNTWGQRTRLLSVIYGHMIAGFITVFVDSPHAQAYATIWLNYTWTFWSKPFIPIATTVHPSLLHALHLSRLSGTFPSYLATAWLNRCLNPAVLEIAQRTK